MASPSDSPKTILPQNSLPPVEPPSAGFIVQLFVVPGVIVTIIVLVWLMFNWLAQQGNDPNSYVEALSRNNDARWQAAANLADALHNDQQSATLKDDADVAKKLTDILDTEIATGSLEEKPLNLRIYLCHALGEFHSPKVLPVLLKAAKTQRDERENAVRFAAIKGLAVWAGEAKPEVRNAQGELLPVLLEASRDTEPLIRSTAAFGLGALSSPKADDRLKQMLDDAYVNVRYNAATMLARRGDEKSIPVLAEMLDPQQTVAIETEDKEDSREFKQAMILVNALRAASELSGANSSADLSRLYDAALKLSTAPLPQKMRGEVHVRAADVAHELAQRPKAPAAAESTAP
jgi:hypothetical protein